MLSTAFASARLDERIGGEAGGTAEDGSSLSESLAEVGYWLVFLLFLPAVLGALAIEGLLDPVQNMVDQVLGFLPKIVGAGIILAVGWFVATLVRRIVTNLLTAVGVNALGERAGFNTGNGMSLAGLIGLVVYALIRRGSLLGPFDLLFTPAAMIVGQVILALPITAALSLTAISSLDRAARETAATLGASARRVLLTTAWEARYGLLAAIAAAGGRLIGEVGASMMLGGNIAGHTRSLTTAIALETAKGEFAFGLALGIVLLCVALIVNLFLNLICLISSGVGSGRVSGTLYI